MVGFLPPLVQEAPISGLTTLLLYGGSSIVAGAAVDAAIGGAGVAALRPGEAGVAGVIVVAAAAACAAVELVARRPRLLEWRRQVPASWRYDYGPWRAALLYGGSLGTGLTTYISYAGFYTILVLAATRGPRAGAALGAIYGAAQALPVLLAGATALFGARPPLHGQVLIPAVMHRAVGAACLAVALVALLSRGA